VKNLQISFCCFFISLWFSSVNAADSFDAQSGVLSIPLVNVNDTYYSNVRVLIGSVRDIGIKKSIGLAYDVYDTSTNELYIPIVNVGQTTYYFVTVTVEKVLGLDGNVIPILKSNEPQAYKKLVTPNPPVIDALLSVSVPRDITKPSPGSNLRVWISDPLNPSVGLKNGALFISPDTATKSCKYYGPSPDGSMSLTLYDGAYVLDTVEPSGSTVYTRKTYNITVSNGVVNIPEARLDASGFFILTILSTLKNQARDDLIKSATKSVNDSFTNFKSVSPCNLKDQTTTSRSTGSLSAGFPKVSSKLSSYGRIKALIIPVDFSDLPGSDNPLSFFSPIAKSVSDFYVAQSFGKVAFDFDIVANWVRMPKPSTDYKRTQTGAVTTGDYNGYLGALFQATDGPIDFNQYESVYFLVPKEMPTTTMQNGPAFCCQKTSNGFVNNGATGGADMYLYTRNGPKKSALFWMAHETGHLFNLFDEDMQHLSQTLGYFSLMANNWSTGSIELGAWDRYILGWLDASQSVCLDSSNISLNPKGFELTPISRQSNDLKALLIPLSKSKILVIESRKNEGYDVISAQNEGVLVYTVDMTLGTLSGGYKIQPRVGVKDTNSYLDGLLKAGDSITVENIKILVQKLSGSADTVLISSQ